MSLVFALLYGVSGGVVASTLLTWFWRNEQHYSWMRGRSQCDSCSTELSKCALVPFVGCWFGCNNCHHKPLYSMIAEIGTAVLWIWWFLSPFPLWPLGIFNSIISALLLVLAVIDWKWQKIPLFLIFIAFFITFVASLFGLLPESNFGMRCLGALVSGGFFGWQYVLSRGRWIGKGDIFLGIFLGFLFGWQRILLVLAGGYCLAALVSLIYIAIQRKNNYRVVPLGAFLCIASIIFLVYYTY